LLSFPAQITLTQLCARHFFFFVGFSGDLLIILQKLFSSLNSLVYYFLALMRTMKPMKDLNILV